MRIKLELIAQHSQQVDSAVVNCATLSSASATGAVIGVAAARTGSSISAPVTANVTGGSGSSGVHSNV